MSIPTALDFPDIEEERKRDYGLEQGDVATTKLEAVSCVTMVQVQLLLALKK